MLGMSHQVWLVHTHSVFRTGHQLLPPQVVTKFTSASDEAQLSLDVQTHPLWFGSHDDDTTPVVTKATRQDVRLIAAFNNQVSKNHLELVGAGFWACDQLTHCTAALTVMEDVVLQPGDLGHLQPQSSAPCCCLSL